MLVLIENLFSFKFSNNGIVLGLLVILLYMLVYLLCLCVLLIIYLINFNIDGFNGWYRYDMFLFILLVVIEYWIKLLVFIDIKFVYL